MSLETSEVRVWDPALRLFHWLLVAGFFTAYFTEEDWMPLHTWAGYLVCGLLVFRLIWGFTGPRRARFSDFVHRPAQVLSYLRAILTLQAPRYLGHNPAGGAMIIVLLLCVAIATISGMLLYGADAWLGPFAAMMKNTSDGTIRILHELHEVTANLTVALVIVHVLGVFWESFLHRENLIKAMITGRKRDNTTGKALVE
jgi:cytochrome b